MSVDGKALLNVIMVGVGGQGSILASHLLADAALMEGREVKLAETYGGATRGGSVLAHVRIGAVWSAVTPEDGADVVVAMEPLEGLRVSLTFLRHGGWVLLNTHPWYPVDVSAGGTPYPTMGCIIDALQRLGARVIAIDATALAVQAGNERAANSVLLGGLFALGEIDVKEYSLFQAMEKRWAGRLVQVNRRAYELGCRFVQEQKGTK